MKHFLIILVLITGVISVGFSQKNNQLIPTKTTAGGDGSRTSGETPRSFIVISNKNNTFIKDSLNYLSAVSHGYDDTKLECINCTIKQEETTLDYLVYTPKEGKCQINIYAINRETRATVSLGSYFFEVADSVYHSIYLDNILSGNTVTSAVSKIDCQNRDYWNWQEEMEIISWKLNYQSTEISGKGNELNREARNLIKDIPSGFPFVLTIQAKSNFQKPFITKGTFLKK